MVAKIKSGKSIRGVLLYNEQKVEERVAECIGAIGFGLAADELNFYQKLARFEKLLEKNSRVKTNALHISLNFDPSEKFDREKLMEIADTYMVKLGFGQQPYLVYEHRDAGHPHIHIATTNVQADGKRIDLNNIGRNQSEKARKEIEIAFGMVKAEDRKQQQQLMDIIGMKLEKLTYGKQQTKRAISNIVGKVMQEYKFASLAEYNAALGCYGVVASRGAEGTRMFQGRGLSYQAIDQKGKLVGASVKASAIYGKPTLAELEQRFEKNKKLKHRYKAMLKLSIDRAVRTFPKDHVGLTAKLKQQDISILYRKNAEGRTYGLTFVDHRHKVVMNGSQLGKAYSLKGLEQRLGFRETGRPVVKQAQFSTFQVIHLPMKQGHRESLLELMIKSPEEFSQVPLAFKKRKKRRKRNHS
jgi:hypothetical protein